MQLQLVERLPEYIAWLALKLHHKRFKHLRKLCDFAFLIALPDLHVTGFAGVPLTPVDAVVDGECGHFAEVDEDLPRGVLV